MTIVVIKNQQRRTLFMIPISFAFAVVGFYFLKKTGNPVLGWPIIVFFGLIIPGFVLATSEGNESVVFNDSGILDKSLGVGIIAWEDIVSVHTEAKYNNNYICLKLKNSEKYLSRMSDARRRQLHHTRDLGFTHFNVEVSQAEQDLYYLLDIIKKKMKTSVG